MKTYDIIYFKGNPNSGSFEQHETINNEILKIISSYSFQILESNHKNLENIEQPKAKVYIGFSRGSRYLSKLSNKTLRISIGGINGSSINLFKNKDDHVVLGDMSEESLEAHFTIIKEDKEEIKKLIKDFLQKS